MSISVNLIIDSISRCGGGLLDAERSLHREMARLGVNTRVFSLDDAFASEDLSSWSPLVPRIYSTTGPSALGWSPQLNRELSGSEADLLYRVGLWHLTSQASHAWRRKYDRPEIVAPHGMLDPWALSNSGWKKKIAAWWFEDRHLRDASVIRALCQSEADSIRAYGLRNPVAVIPNGIHLPANATGPVTSGAFHPVVLFLGRLHPKKGLTSAISAWQVLNDSVPEARDWRFAIAGWDQNGHLAQLQQQCTNAGLRYRNIPVDSWLEEQGANSLAGSIDFLGPVFGPAKERLLERASAFVLPSFSEGLPMSVLEAWAFQLPVLMTPHCHLPEGYQSKAAIEIGTDVQSIAKGFRALLSMTEANRRAMGLNGRQLVETRFTWSKIAHQLDSVYRWLLYGGAAPACVQGS